MKSVDLAPIPRALIYAAPNLMQTVFTVVAVIFLPAFYAQERGLSLAAIGTAILAARLLDIVVDPALGTLSDLTPKRWGGRKLWVGLGAPLVAVTTWILFVPPHNVGAVYLTVALIAWYAVYSGFTISYYAWGAEVVTGYKERGVLIGVREFMGLVGFCAVQGLVMTGGKGIGATPGETLHVFALCVVLVMPVACGLAISLIRERPEQQTTDLEQPVGDFRAILSGFRTNGPFRRVMTSHFALVFGANTFGTVLLFLCERIFHLKGFTMIFIFGMMIVAASLAPLSIYLGNRFGKHRILALANFIYVGSFIALFMLPTGDWRYLVPIIVCLGFAYSIMMTLPSAMVSETADYFALRTRKWQPGIFLAGFVFVNKLATALSASCALWLVGLSGFNVNGPNDVRHELLFKAIGLLLPAVFALAGGLLLLRYPITARRHAAIRHRLEGGAARRATAAAPAIGPGRPPRGEPLASSGPA